VPGLSPITKTCQRPDLVGWRGWRTNPLRPNWTRSSGVRSATPSTGDPDEFDAATGPDSFRGQGSNKKREYWFTGDEAGLADFVSDDVVVMNIVSLGFYWSDTQAGGNTTAPWFQVVKITRKGSCD
jgi:hypothetical protein